jgi:hypothetical protein
MIQDRQPQHARQNTPKRKLIFLPPASAAILAFSLSVYIQSAYANPTGATAVSGSVLTSNPSANVLQVVNTPGTIIN